MTKKTIEFAYEKRRRNARILHTGASVLACLALVAYLFYSGHLSVAKLLAVFGG